MRKGKIIVASMMVLCVLIFVAAAAWFMLFQGEMTEPTEEEKQAAILPLRIELLSLSKWKSKKSPERITDFHSIKTDMPLSIQVCNVRQR
ncbi:hypothetical protein AWF54_27045 [Escherichia coli]|nr:hypothetical protein AWF54_27045 [Escherichia coli]